MLLLRTILFNGCFHRRGSLLSAAIFVYAATSPVNGYTGGSMYSRFGGKLWIKQMVLSAFFLPVTVCGTAFCINFIAMYYHASRAIPFTIMVVYIYLTHDMAIINAVVFLAGCDRHLHLCDITIDSSGNCAGS